jgi:hypothetical protein
MDKQDWINTLNQMQQANAAYSALTKNQRDALTEALDALRSATQSLSEGFDLHLSDCRAIDGAFWRMHNAFEHMEPTEYQLTQLDLHGLEWDYDTQTWSEVTPDSETVDDWEPNPS